LTSWRRTTTTVDQAYGNDRHPTRIRLDGGRHGRIYTVTWAPYQLSLVCGLDEVRRSVRTTLCLRVRQIKACISRGEFSTADTWFTVEELRAAVTESGIARYLRDRAQEDWCDG
jgi:hypothetical protein